MFNSNAFRVSIIALIILTVIMYLLKPQLFLFYDEENKNIVKLKNFGISKNETLFPYPIVLAILLVCTYMIVSLFDVFC